MVRFLAIGIDPDRADEIQARLMAVAGAEGVAADTPGSWSRRARYHRRAILAGDAPLPEKVRRALAERRGELWVGKRRLRELPQRVR